MTLEDVRTWREAAINDGWEHEPTYTLESEDQAMRLKKDGWVAQTLARPKRPSKIDRFRPLPEETSILIWGPDGMQVFVLSSYDWDLMVQGLRVCAYCFKTDVETKRVGFAGRCCSDCLPEMRKKIEIPGWCN